MVGFRVPGRDCGSVGPAFEAIAMRQTTPTLCCKSDGDQAGNSHNAGVNGAPIGGGQAISKVEWCNNPTAIDAR